MELVLSIPFLGTPIMKNILSFALPLWIHFWIGSIKKDIPNKTLKVKLLSVFLEYLSISPTPPSHKVLSF